MAVHINNRAKAKILNLFIALICFASLANANFGINSGTYQQKEVILTSITGNKVNIDVGGNTNIKGSLVAAGNFDENGNFIDNKQLDLLTDTLTYSSLSNTMFSSSNSFGAGTNIGFGKSNTQDAEGNKQSNTNSKVNSSNTNFETSIGYSSEKTQATIGQGTITVRDKENSDELNGLNRNIDNMNNLLYSGGIGLDVESTSMVGLPKDMQNIINGAFGASTLINNIDNINVFDITKGIESTLGTINNIGYFIGNVENSANSLKNTENEKEQTESKSKQEIENMFRTNNKNKMPLIPIPSELTITNKGYDAVEHTSGLINNIDNINSIGDVKGIYDDYRNIKEDIKTIKDKINK